ncbi:MAG TPA: TonB-dependent receptor [Burkholderiaceae bacterium]|nr:TonB-dependent receptor [Burkholderiaceae bacterium]
MKQLLAASAAAMAIASPAAQTVEAETTLPTVTVSAERPARSLTVPDTEQATYDIQRTPGAVTLIPETSFKEGSARTVRDILGWVPGVVTQSRWGPDARLSIRGSGLSRNYGNRGINMLMDGIPINTADGLFDLFEIDPTAYRYVEVFKGANALRYGANALGGAINFVTPTGRDAFRFEGRVDVGSFGHRKGQASTGAAHGPWDYFVTGSAERFDGYREHSDGRQQRLSGNVGYAFSPTAETRFYLNANSWRSRLPGEVTKEAALRLPRVADPEFVRLDQQRNIDSLRLANKTTLLFGPTTLEFGLFAVRRHVMHPIYQWLDYRVRDHGGFVRAVDDRMLGAYRNRVVAGLNIHNGTIDNAQFINLPGGVKGDLVSSNVDKSENISVYVENSFFVRPDVALVAGAQFQHAVRDRRDRFLADGDQSGRRSYDDFSPKLGIVWDVGPDWQLFANVSRSAEVPTFDANTFASPASSDLSAQTATTYEVGTRSRRGGLAWELSLYRAQIRNELQCLTTAPWSPCTVVNADRTVHQGIEAAFGFAFLDSAFDQGDRFWLSATYTYNDFFFDGDANYGNNRLPGVPRHQVRAEILYRHPSGFYAGPNVEWMPKGFFADNANRLKVDSYSLLNFRIGLGNRLAGWSAYLEGRNLLDKRYISSTIVAGTATADSALFNPGTGRSVYAGLHYQW